ncbi:MAG: HAD family hydrolase [Caldicoprobacterales bacterium]|jgi:hydroxymethylpyrimidine pyrophosphatase-like HAD family hydrolase|nr:HAD family phosphatase [Clostridiales bacterium]
MRRQKPYVIFLDIDGTLYTTEAGIPQENIDAIHQVRQEGHMVLVNTGRSYANIPVSIMESVPLDGAVSALGSDVRIGGEQLHSCIFSPDQLYMITEYFLSEKRYCVLEGEEEVFVINPRKVDSKVPISSPDDFVTLYPNARINILAARGVVTDREKELFGDDFFHYQHDRYYECALRGNSKSRGMEMIMNHLGLTRQDSIAIGDSLNDVDMLQYAGLSIAMEDAHDKVKEVCDAITYTAEQAGVAAALRKYVLEKEYSYI